MKKLLITYSLLGTFTAAFAQNETAMKFAGYITPDDAKKHLSIIASDAFEGRETGKPGAEKAANYIAGEFKKLGLEAPVNGSYFLNVPLVDNVLTASFSLNGKTLNRGYDYALTGAHADKTIKAGDIVFIGYGTAAELGNTDITGKVVLWINEDKPQPGVTNNIAARLTPERNRVVAALRSKNPAIILAANPDITNNLKQARAAAIHTNPKIKTDKPIQLDTQPVSVMITSALADEILKSTGKTFAQLITDAGSGTNTVQTIKADVNISYHTEVKDLKAVDVLGYLPGTDLKDELVIFSAHYDHIGLNPEGPDKVNNGADDDGSGTTGVLEMARAFTEAKKAGHGPRRSLLFLGNVGEEKGLLGSEYYSDHPVFPLANTIADVNTDMIGRIGYDYQGKPDSANSIYVVGSAMLSKELKQINETANNTYTKLHLDYKYDDPNDPERVYYRSDHYNFAKHGIPIVFYTSGLHDDYHKPGDEVSKINFPALVKRAQLAFYTGWELANRDKRPVVDAVPGK
jgi:hypothetical protein